MGWGSCGQEGRQRLRSTCSLHVDGNTGRLCCREAGPERLGLCRNAPRGHASPQSWSPSPAYLPSLPVKKGKGFTSGLQLPWAAEWQGQSGNKGVRSGAKASTEVGFPTAARAVSGKAEQHQEDVGSVCTAAGEGTGCGGWDKSTKIWRKILSAGSQDPGG